MRILFIGDVVGKSGRRAVAHLLPKLNDEFSLDFVIANGENAAGGMGITRDTALELFQSGVNCITLGNHVWTKKEAYAYIHEETRLIRPANYPFGTPGEGYRVYTLCTGDHIGIINLCGRVFMDHLENPFTVADCAIGNLSAKTKVIIVDFHAEATSEKSAMGWYLAGRVSAVIGTHTHIQTADEKLLSGKTAYITDVGMTGPEDSVIGVKKDLIISRFLTLMPTKFEPAEGKAMLSAVLLDVDTLTGQAIGIQRINRVFND